MVRASIIGAILANLLLALGIAFFLGGLRHRDQKYNPAAARIYSSMMLLAAASLAVPSAFSRYLRTGRHHTAGRAAQSRNRGRAAADLRALPAVFSSRRIPATFASVEGARTSRTMPRALEHAGRHRRPRRRVGAGGLDERDSGRRSGGDGKALGMSQIFIGIVFLAIIGGAAESASAIAMARKDKMDLSVGIALGSSHPDRVVRRAGTGVRELPRLRRSRWNCRSAAPKSARSSSAC